MEKRTAAIESDNVLLSGAIERTRQIDAAKTQSDATPLPRAEVEDRFKRARALAANGDPELALRELLWCYDEGFPRMGGSKGISFEIQKGGQIRIAADVLAQLGERYPPAQAILRERLENVRQRLLSRADDPGSIDELSFLARALKDQTAVISLFDQTSSDDPRRKSLVAVALDDFVTAHRYADALLVRDYRTMNTNFALTSQVMRDPAIKQAAINIEILAGAGDFEHAQALTERLLKFDNSPEARALVQKHLERAGRPELSVQWLK
ncbi:MAG: hypothetical protein ABIY47_15205 [Opitutaceae bacterium]